MPNCQIFQVAEQGGVRWKWSRVTLDGAVEQSAESYAFHYQCAAAARNSGYRPEMKWLAVKSAAGCASAS